MSECFHKRVDSAAGEMLVCLDCGQVFNVAWMPVFKLTPAQLQRFQEVGELADDMGDRP